MLSVGLNEGQFLHEWLSCLVPLYCKAKSLNGHTPIKARDTISSECKQQMCSARQVE